MDAFCKKEAATRFAWGSFKSTYKRDFKQERIRQQMNETKNKGNAQYELIGTKRSFAEFPEENGFT